MSSMIGRISPGIQYGSGKEGPVISCFRCGVCCTRFRVGLSPEETWRIAEYLGISREDFLSRYTDPYWCGRNGFFLRQEGDACVFLEYQAARRSRCLINPVKPESCREWTASLYRRECRQGLAGWGLRVNPAGSLEGSVEDLGEFHQYLESLAEGRRRLKCTQ